MNPLHAKLPNPRENVMKTIAIVGVIKKAASNKKTVCPRKAPQLK